MNPHVKSLVLLALLAALASGEAHAENKTVCTITVNSSDEKEIFQQRLPKDKFQFVELVERGRPDWLASACEKGIQCDVLVISGHFAGTNFFSEQVDTKEFLPVDEMERVSCSDSCPGLFSRLKEVYLFGCNTLNGESLEDNSAEIVRTLMRSGSTRTEAERESRVSTGRFGETNRDHMRRIFFNVPVIYGFSSKAPVGAAAASTLSRYFQSTGGAEVGSGRVSTRLLAQLASNGLTAAGGVGETGSQAAYRDEVCQFYDERRAPEEKLDFIHQILARNMAEVRRFLDHIEKFSGSLAEQDRQAPAVSAQLDRIAGDQAARDRYLAFARDTDRSEIRARMIKLAGTLGWLSPEAQRTELVQVVGDVLARNVLGASDVEFVCALNESHQLDTEPDRFRLAPSQRASTAHAASLACLGSIESHARMLHMLASADARDVQIAQVYFRHRPITDVAELRAVAMEIAHMPDSEAKVRALDTLAGHYLSDRQSLDELARLFPRSESVNVQRAIAGILLRSDFKSIAKAELIRMLSERRLRSPDGQDIIDVLIRRLRVS